jgi:hypothetical protein
LYLFFFHAFGDLLNVILLNKDFLSFSIGSWPLSFILLSWLISKTCNRRSYIRFYLLFIKFRKFAISVRIRQNPYHCTFLTSLASFSLISLACIMKWCKCISICHTISNFKSFPDIIIRICDFVFILIVFIVVWDLLILYVFMVFVVQITIKFLFTKLVTCKFI